jgi:HPt (histidine-containing phosphotransfer) domain-containing protein
MVRGDASLLREVVQAMVQELPAVSQQLLQACQQGEADQLRRAAHTIKGICRTIGARAAHDLALDIEREAQRGQTHDLHPRVAALQQHVQRMLDELRAHLQLPPD